jgi:hypothetical protein
MAIPIPTALRDASRDSQRRARDAVNALLDQAIEGTTGQDQREDLRVTYFGPATIRPEGSRFPRVSAFTRDLSPLGIGLLHVMPLDPGKVVVELALPHGGTLELLAQIVWCRDCGEGWYISGGRFLDVIDG